MPVGPSAGLSAGFPAESRSFRLARALHYSAGPFPIWYSGWQGARRGRGKRACVPYGRLRQTKGPGLNGRMAAARMGRGRATSASARCSRRIWWPLGMWGAWPDGRAGRTCFSQAAPWAWSLPARGRLRLACLPAAGALRCIRWWALWRPSWRLRVPSAASWGRCRGLPRRFQTGRMARRGSLSAWAAFLWRWFGLPPMRRFLSWRLSGKAPFRFFGEWRWRPLGSGRLRDFPWRCASSCCWRLSAVSVVFALQDSAGGQVPAGRREPAGGACGSRGDGVGRKARACRPWHACVRPRRMCVRRLRRPRVCRGAGAAGRRRGVGALGEAASPGGASAALVGGLVRLGGVCLPARAAVGARSSHACVRQ